MNRSRRDEGCEVAKPTGCEDRDAMINTKAGGRYRQRAAPTREDDGLGLPMMWSGVKPGYDATRIDFEQAVTSAGCRAIVKHENVRPDMVTPSKHALPVKIACPEFLGGVLGSSSLPFAEFEIEGGRSIRLRGMRGVISPEIGEGLPRVFATLDGRPIRKGATLGAG